VAHKGIKLSKQQAASREPREREPRARVRESRATATRTAHSTAHSACVHRQCCAQRTGSRQQRQCAVDFHDFEDEPCIACHGPWAMACAAPRSLRLRLRHRRDRGRPTSTEQQSKQHLTTQNAAPRGAPRWMPCAAPHLSAYSN
jgi:hypothetical protein